MSETRGAAAGFRFAGKIRRPLRGPYGSLFGTRVPSKIFRPEKVRRMIETTINAQTVNYLEGKKLARMIKDMVFDKEYIVRIFNFFTDVPLQDVERFAAEHGITEETLKT